MSKKELNREEVLRRLTEMVEKGEAFAETARKVHEEFEEFDDELNKLVESDEDFTPLQGRINKVMVFLLEG